MERITLDFETYYSNEYTLKKCTPVEYILDPRYETIMLSVKRPGRAPFALPGEKVQAFFDQLEPDRTITITHNALFDNCIMAWRYNFTPRLMVCTMAMSQAWWGHVLKSVALASVAPFAGVGIKGQEVVKMLGLRLADIRSMGLYPQYATYCSNDSVLCEAIFEKIMAEGFPVSELEVMDSVLRMAVTPQFQLNFIELATHAGNIATEKFNLLAQAQCQKEDLMSNPKFAALLESLGVDPPLKVSPTTGRETFAFAKSDKGLTELENHPDPAVQALVAARLGHKSTIEETRTQRLLACAQLQWPESYLASRAITREAQLMPMPLRYGAAHTGRLGGDWKLNVQNLPARGKENHLKKSLMARSQHTVLNIDSSQIEARIVAWLAGEKELMRQFAEGRDPYRIFAGSVFGIEPSLVNAEQRFLGKTSILGLGFGLGWIKFKAQVRVKSVEAIRLTGKGRELILDDIDAQRIVYTYRNTFPGVPKLWRQLDNAIGVLAGNGRSFEIGPCIFERGRIRLPNGLYLKYHNVRHTPDGWLYDYANETRKLYGGALLENIVQALARIIVMDAAIRIKKQLRPYGIDLALQVHDALAYVVPDEMVTFASNLLHTEMNREVPWAKELVLAAELKTGSNYGECK